jgi:hypothetical protein
MGHSTEFDRPPAGKVCPPPPEPAELTPVSRKALHSVEPLPPGQVAVLVRNSTARHRLATRVAARLELMGFAQAAPVVITWHCSLVASTG